MQCGRGDVLRSRAELFDLRKTSRDGWMNVSHVLEKERALPAMTCSAKLTHR
jgi:hypothetical protein